MRHRLPILLLLLGLSWVPAHAEIQTRPVEYRAGDTVMEGYLAWDDAVSGPRPGVLVAHAWMGLGEYEQRRARELAALGYAAFALDLYGKGVRPQGPAEAGKLSAAYKADRPLMRERARAALDALAGEDLCAGRPLAAIGYCFGGMVVLELARGGAPLAGVVSFHGGLATPDPADARQIRGAVLVLHGADDPHVPPEEVAAFEKEMRDAGVDWQFVAYGGAVHAFSDPGAGNDPSRGAAYHEKADRRSWAAMRSFLDEVLRR
ncbi:MAG: dienelactone hydrolase family protein [Kiritimatiellae bacterium]|nr:dienelactone hydrolase family protein [Kiritimatiellia bacterium]